MSDYLDKAFAALPPDAASEPIKAPEAWMARHLKLLRMGRTIDSIMQTLEYARPGALVPGETAAALAAFYAQLCASGGVVWRDQTQSTRPALMAALAAAFEALEAAEAEASAAPAPPPPKGPPAGAPPPPPGAPPGPPGPPPPHGGAGSPPPHPPAPGGGGGAAAAAAPRPADSSSGLRLPMPASCYKVRVALCDPCCASLSNPCLLILK